MRHREYHFQFLYLFSSRFGFILIQNSIYGILILIIVGRFHLDLRFQVDESPQTLMSRTSLNGMYGM